MISYTPKTLEELERINQRETINGYIRAFLIITLVLAVYVVLMPSVGKSLDQELGIYRNHQGIEHTKQ